MNVCKVKFYFTNGSKSIFAMGEEALKVLESSQGNGWVRLDGNVVNLGNVKYCKVLSFDRINVDLIKAM
jgi:hypothetical protein